MNKEIEYQTLEIELCEKRIRECQAQAEQKGEVVTDSKEKVELREADLESKKTELSGTVAETQQEEDVLNTLSAKMAKGTDYVVAITSASAVRQETDWPWCQSSAASAGSYQDPTTALNRHRPAQAHHR